jgi:hypothetical protein
MPIEQSLRFAGNHGYRIDGDTAWLNADLAIGEVVPNFGSCSLQLWASEQPYHGGPASGVKVAEVPVGLPSSPDAPVLRLEAETFARIPLGGREYFMALVLASNRPGAPDEVYDVAIYPQSEHFVLPHLDGNVGYSIEGERVVVHVERLVNPRPLGSCSGSLALELRAMPESSFGAEADEFVLARTELEPIAGGCVYEPPPLDVALSLPPPGEWRIALLLREWTRAAGFVTRDCSNFYVPFRSPPVAAAGTANELPAPEPTRPTLESASEPEPAALAPRSAHGVAKRAEALPEAQPASPTGSHDEVALAAYYRYLDRGPSGGDAVGDWLAAEEDVRRRVRSGKIALAAS